jgi:PIH1 N-terminal domain
MHVLCMYTYKQVFLNICSNDIIGMPGPKKRLNDQGNEVEVHNVPISVGPARPQTDKAGVSSTVYDIVVNPKVNYFAYYQVQLLVHRYS